MGLSDSRDSRTLSVHDYSATEFFSNRHVALLNQNMWLSRRSPRKFELLPKSKYHNIQYMRLNRLTEFCLPRYFAIPLQV